LVTEERTVAKGKGLIKPRRQRKKSGHEKPKEKETLSKEATKASEEEKRQTSTATSSSSPASPSFSVEVLGDVDSDGAEEDTEKKAAGHEDSEKKTSGEDAGDDDDDNDDDVDNDDDDDDNDDDVDDDADVVDDNDDVDDDADVVDDDADVDNDDFVASEDDDDDGDDDEFQVRDFWKREATLQEQVHADVGEPGVLLFTRPGEATKEVGGARKVKSRVERIRLFILIRILGSAVFSDTTGNENARPREKEVRDARASERLGVRCALHVA
jgi:hypothetical protein